MADYDNEEVEIDLKKYFVVLKKRWWLIILLMAIGIISSTIFVSKAPPIYEATALLKIGKVRNMPLEGPETVMEISKTNPILEKIALSLSLSIDEGMLNILKRRITISRIAGLLEIKGRGKSPQEAVDLVNAAVNLILQRHQKFFAQGKQILQEYIDDSNKRLKEIESTIDNIEKKIEKLENTDSEAKAIIAQGYMTRLENTLMSYRTLQVALREKRMEESYATEATKIDVPAKLPELPVAVKKKETVILTTFVSFFVGLSLVFLIEFFKKIQV